MTASLATRPFAGAGMKVSNGRELSFDPADVNVHSDVQVARSRPPGIVPIPAARRMSGI
jgi:hypothetical protein